MTNPHCLQLVDAFLCKNVQFWFIFILLIIFLLHIHMLVSVIFSWNVVIENNRSAFQRGAFLKNTNKNDALVKEEAVSGLLAVDGCTIIGIQRKVAATVFKTLRQLYHSRAPISVSNLRHEGELKRKHYTFHIWLNCCSKIALTLKLQRMFICFTRTFS